jgi:5'(3')-deoxyribonucleotidase
MTIAACGCSERASETSGCDTHQKRVVSEDALPSEDHVPEHPNFVLGLDLDGTCADFYGRMREIAAEWTGVPLDSLPVEPEWSLGSWGIGEGQYETFHRFAVTQRNLFETMAPLIGAPQAIRRLAHEGVRIRIITHRLVISYFHETAVAQTVRWLDHHGIPYWDLCFMREKGDVDADLYVEDSVVNIERLVASGADVLIITNGTNRGIDGPFGRADSWESAEEQIRLGYYRWLDANQLERPTGPGEPPPGLVRGNAPSDRIVASEGVRVD